MARIVERLESFEFDLSGVADLIDRPELQPHHVTAERMRQELSKRGRVIPDRTLRDRLKRAIKSGEIRRLENKLFDPISRHWVTVYERVNAKAQPDKKKSVRQAHRRAR